MYMCFIDLQNAYDSFDRELLRVVLACELACVRTVSYTHLTLPTKA